MSADMIVVQIQSLLAYYLISWYVIMLFTVVAISKLLCHFMWTTHYVERQFMLQKNTHNLLLVLGVSGSMSSFGHQTWTRMMTTLLLATLLLMCGDIESNPGPGRYGGELQ